jgi:hypothetical protein
MKYARSWHGKAAPETEIGRGEISSANARLKARFNHVPIVFTGVAPAHSQLAFLHSLDEHYIASAT